MRGLEDGGARGEIGTRRRARPAWRSALASSARLGPAEPVGSSFARRAAREKAERDEHGARRSPHPQCVYHRPRGAAKSCVRATRGGGAMRVILASASPRRAEILARVAYPFAIVPAEIDEARLPGEDPESHVLRLAREKAARVSRMHPDAWVLGADTIVAQDDDIFGKPADDADAARMLARLSAAPHRVLTGLAWARGGEPVADATSRSDVRFRHVADREIADYVASGEPRDKAGAYAIQGGAARFVESVRGSVTGVIGLPLEDLSALAARLGIPAPVSPLPRGGGRAAAARRRGRGRGAHRRGGATARLGAPGDGHQGTSRRAGTRRDRRRRDRPRRELRPGGGAQARRSRRAADGALAPDRSAAEQQGGARGAHLRSLPRARPRGDRAGARGAQRDSGRRPPAGERRARSRQGRGAARAGRRARAPARRGARLRAARAHDDRSARRRRSERARGVPDPARAVRRAAAHGLRAPVGAVHGHERRLSRRDRRGRDPGPPRHGDLRPTHSTHTRGGAEGTGGEVAS